MRMMRVEGRTWGFCLRMASWGVCIGRLKICLVEGRSKWRGGGMRTMVTKVMETRTEISSCVEDGRGEGRMNEWMRKSSV